MPNLAAFADRGVQAEHLQPEDPAFSLTGFGAMSTGKRAAGSGLPSALSQLSGGVQSGQDSQTEPVWRTAMRSGLRTATVFWPTATLEDPQQFADLMVVTASSDIPSAQHTLVLTDIVDWQGGPTSYSPPREAQLTLTSSTDGIASVFRVVALDSQDDAQAAYDVLLVDDDHDLANGYAEIRLNQWASMTVSPRLHSGVSCCFTASTGPTVTLYSSQAVYSQARPQELLQSVNRDFGIPPPPPDAQALHAGWISAEQYVEMALLRQRWMDDVTLFVYRTYAPELLLTNRTLLADYAGVFLLVDGRQDGYGPEKAETYAAHLKDAHTILDEGLRALLTQVGLISSSVFVVSPNGYAAVHTAVNVNTILAGAKLLTTSGGGKSTVIDVSKSRAWAAAHQGMAHIYISLEGREKTGIVAAADYAGVQEQILSTLVAASDETGQPVFSRVLRREQLETLHLDSPDAGDVVAQANPGYTLVGVLGMKESLNPAPSYAGEGFVATLPEMHGVFFAAGGRLATGKSISPVSILDLAPTLCQALGIQPLSGLEGSAIEGIWN
jgi:hypothetical protein